jgi:DNA segregation ATPase FtsK/SpoIIIE, S-DNA-T family
MAKKDDGKDKEETGKKGKGLPPDFGHEIWGVIFLAIGLLVFISLVSALVNRDDNILGRYLGSDLANGLLFLFGPLPSFLIPLAIMSVGWQRLRGKILRLRTYAFWTLVTVEVCGLLAIHHLPRAVDGTLLFADNALGKVVTYFLHFIFGAHQFGPYFILSLALVITVLIGLRIPVRVVIDAASPYLAQMWRWFLGLFSGLVRQPVEEELAEEEVSPDGEKLARKPRKLKPAEEQPAVTPAIVASAPAAKPTKEEEDEAHRQLDKQLAEFRAKKNQPITITTPEVAEESLPEGDKEVEIDEVQEAAFVDALKESVVDKPSKKKRDKKEKEPQPEESAVEGEPPPEGDGAGEVADPGEAADVHDEYFKLPSVEPIVAKLPDKPYVMPSPDVIPEPPPYSTFIDRAAIERNSATLEKTLLNFGVEGKVSNVSPGPVITRYEIELAPGVKVSRVVSLQDDISIAVGGQKIRILPHIPGKAAIGIELPNDDRQIVYFKHVLVSEAFTKSKSKLAVVVGRSTSGAPFVTDIAKMPHLLIAGQTGAGKSVCINTFICSLLMSKTPQDLRFIMIDPKKVELSYFEGIPHLLAKVVTEPKEAVTALRWGVKEVERRYRLFARAGARNIESFNDKLQNGKLNEESLAEAGGRTLPMIVIVVDELADLMITAPRDVETCIQRIAQLARAVGIHLIVATQRPSVDVITGRIKANLASRVAFRTIQATDSRTILEHVGAEKLLGQGDMLFLRSGAPDIERFHGAYTSEQDVELIVNEIRKQAYETVKIERFEDKSEEGEGDGEDGGGDGELDEMFPEAARTVVSIGQGSTSLLQRRMKIGYARAGRIMDELEKAGFVGPQEGSKVREVRVKPQEVDDLLRQMGYT